MIVLHILGLAEERRLVSGLHIGHSYTTHSFLFERERESSSSYGMAVIGRLSHRNKCLFQTPVDRQERAATKRLARADYGSGCQRCVILPVRHCGSLARRYIYTAPQPRCCKGTRGEPTRMLEDIYVSLHLCTLSHL